MKKIFAAILSVIMLFGLCIPAFADSENEGYSEIGIDIPAGEGIWIQEKPGETGAWFGVDNTPPVFEAPESLSNRWLTPYSDDWKEALLKISDEAIVNEIKVKNYWIYLKEEMIAEGEKLQDIYVKTESDWNEDDIKADDQSDLGKNAGNEKAVVLADVSPCQSAAQSPIHCTPPPFLRMVRVSEIFL